MEIFFTDKEIQDLLNEKKHLVVTLDDLLHNMKPKKGHKQAEQFIKRTDGSSFVLKIRVSNENTLDFSAILGFVPANRTNTFLLRRYNGKSHEHRNRLEKEVFFYDFHIHTATERYQREGAKEEHYAETTDRYSNIQGALDCLIKDCNIELPPNSQVNIQFN
ncbi:MAG: hypothetical protein FVQ77_13540 [Cytophagales bacterium]|nr:hypothetical protein [Cytophagales bacterium]